MPYDDPDPTDPMTLHGIEVETDDPQAVRQMAACFIEELVRSGMPARQILEIFESKDFAGPALAMQDLGPSEISELIQHELAKRPGGSDARRIVDRAPSGAIELTVLTT